jgi:ABC-2 type transport system permease protein
VFLTSGLFLGGALGMGMLVSVVTKNQLQSNQIAMIATFLPSFLLSGFVFPIENMPLVIQAVTRVVPARYFIGLLRDIYLKGLGLRALALETALLAAFGAAMIAVAVLRFRKRLE